MSKKISELTSAVSITGTEEVPIVQSGETKKATVDLLRPTIATQITSSSTNTEVAGAKAVYDNSLETYSTAEQRIGTWIDGKPLYSKVINIGTLPSSATQVRYPHGILNLERIYKFDGIAYGKTDGSHNGFALPYTINSSTLVGIFWDGTDITVATTLDRSGYIGLFIVYYTKATDTATNSLNTSQLMNTGSLVGMGSTANLDVIDRTEIAEQEGSGDTV